MTERKTSRGYFVWLFVMVVVLGVVAFIVVLAYRKTFRIGPFSVSKKYGDALKVAMQFFDVKKCMGIYDAGDHMKFGFPLAFTATILSWAILEYNDQMELVNQLQPAKDSLKWITDYLVNAHPKPNVFCGVKGPEKRPLTKVTTSKPGSDVVAETAAAMASASLVFKSSSSQYSSLLLKHPEVVFNFANGHRGTYSKSFPQVEAYYKSSGYGDELLWGACWLYHATKDSTYIDFVTGDAGQNFANWGNPTWFSWDDKLPGTHVLLSRVSFFGPEDASDMENINEYRKTAEAIMCNLLPNSPSATSSRTKGGLIWVSKWHALQQPVASAFLALLFSDYMLSSKISTLECDSESFSPSDLREFAISQADYVLGGNPMQMSYLVGYDDEYPKYVHHRGASIPADATTGCKDGMKWLTSSKPNPNVATGALVGGPSENDKYIDSCNNSMPGDKVFLGGIVARKGFNMKRQRKQKRSKADKKRKRQVQERDLRKFIKAGSAR
ncbi:endoglucanase 2-like protein [Tanacetum coccineum]